MDEEKELEEPKNEINQNSILDSIKKLIGIMKEDTNFDIDIVIHINGAFTILNQLGVGPKETYRIKDSNNLWSEFMDESDPMFESVKTFVYLKTKLIFDPPLNSSLLESYNNYVKELEWRLNVSAESN